LNRGPTYIEHDERDENPDIPPPVRVLDVKRKVQELVRGPERAELTSRGRIGVGEVPSGAGNVGIHVLRAGLAAGRVDGRVFDFRTGDLLSAEP
jgi:hypothetical protein